MTTEEKGRTWRQALVEHLTSLRDRKDSGALAALKRSLDGEIQSLARASPVIGRFVPQSAHGWEEDCSYLVAGLFALHPDPGAPKDETLGTAARRIFQSRDSTSIEARFAALLSADAEDLGHHLRHMINLARSEGIPIEWFRLLRDLAQWRHPDGFIQRRWARDFWVGPPEYRSEADNTSPKPGVVE